MPEVQEGGQRGSKASRSGLSRTWGEWAGCRGAVRWAGGPQAEAQWREGHEVATPIEIGGVSEAEQ